MLENRTVSVVVPCYNEETQIARVIETMPSFVDKIIIVNDCSKDRTSEVVGSYINKKDSTVNLQALELVDITEGYSKALQFSQNSLINQKRSMPDFKVVNKEPSKDRVILIEHLKNSKVGAAIATGYYYSRLHRIDCTAVMAGDGQMDPDELHSICLPVILEGIDYVKGNRLIHRSAPEVVPPLRFFGNSVLSILTKIASGYWHVSDTQTGYTAISLKALDSLQLHKIYPDYGVPNDILVKLNIAYCTLKEVEIKPVYNIGEKSKMKIFKVIPKISLLLIKLFFYRLWKKYLYRDFHPLFLLYHQAFFLLILDLYYFNKIISFTQKSLNAPTPTIFAFFFLGIFAFQSFIFAMWMDIQNNDRLYKS